MRQKTVLHLGESKGMDQKRLIQLIQSLSKVTNAVAVMPRGDVMDPQMKIHQSVNYGVPLVIDHFWKILGMSGLVRIIQKDHPRLKFDLEQTFKAALLHRLIRPSSERDMLNWFDTVYLSGKKEIKLQHLYRSIGIIGDYQEEIEDHLLKQSKSLFDVDCSLVFFDTTSTYFEGDQLDEDALKQYGHSKDHRPDRKQVKVGVLMSRDGIPLCTFTLAGNVSDVEAIQSVIEKVRKRWDLKQTVVVSDSGMMSRKNIEDLRNAGIQYILGARMRTMKEIQDQVLVSLGDWQVLKKNLKVQEKEVNGKRYIVCYNPVEAGREKKTREDLILRLQEKLALSSNPKQFIRHRLYKRFLKSGSDSSDQPRLSINHTAIQSDEKYDGIFVLETNTELETDEVALRYKDLILVEQGFRYLKTAVQMRPIYHQTSRNIKGHIFVSYLALYFFCLILKKLEEYNAPLPCEQHEIISTLSRLQAHHVTAFDFQYWLRSEPEFSVRRLLRTLNIKIPPRTLQLLHDPMNEVTEKSSAKSKTA